VDVDMYDEGYESGFAASRLRRYPKSSRGGVPWHKKLSNWRNVRNEIGFYEHRQTRTW
jgi:hypothetical protein